MEWLNPLLRLKELDQKDQLSRSERLEYKWLTRYRAHETYVYLSKMHALEGLQEKLELPRTTENSGEPVSNRNDTSIQQ